MEGSAKVNIHGVKLTFGKKQKDGSVAKNLVIPRLTTGICSEKCVVKRFRRRANVVGCTREYSLLHT